MKVGDYVRTKDGIIGTLYGNYAYDENQLAILTKSNENGVKYTQEYSKEDIAKSSPNIIDLIEVGDYVNGDRVDAIGSKCVIFYDGNGDIETFEDEIKSIVTKEQFESIKYEVVD